MGPTSKGSPLSSLRDQLAEIVVPRNQGVGGSTQTINAPISLGLHIETYSEDVFRQFSFSRMYGQGQGRDVMMTNDGSDKHEELGSARFSYLAATYELRDAKLALGRATIADYHGASVHLATVTELHRESEVKWDAAREAHAKAWIAFDALA